MRKQIAIFLLLLPLFFATYLPGQTLSPSLGTGFSLEKSDAVLSILAVGDVMLGSWVIAVLDQNGSTYPFEQTSGYFKGSDAAIANLEAPFAVSGELFDKKYNFKVPPRHARGLKDSGISVVNLANNHIMDFGESGLITTIATLDSIGLLHCGAGSDLQQAQRPAILETAGKKIAFFGYSMTFPTEFYAAEGQAGTAYPEQASMVKMLRAWEDSVDFTVVSFHWSAEKRKTPKEYQQVFAHLAIDNGADLVLGHHPHVLQGLEVYKNRLIAYSLGNFAFGSYSPYAVDSIILKVNLNKDGLFYALCVPINVDNSEVEFQPRIHQGQRRSRVIKELQELSLPLNAGNNIIGDSGVILGDWDGVYHDWLAEVATLSYWNVVLNSDVLPGASEPDPGRSGPSLNSTH